MQATDIIFFIVLIVVLAGAAYLLHRSDVNTKNKHKMTAYHLLEEKNPDPKKVKETIRLLRLYSGHWRKDIEFVELARLLSDMQHDMEKSGVAINQKPKK
ncbi:MAG: hypothetical protein A2Z15_04190 [Chloroflexi bacterium RBG_16_50_11]|nr:MAG: hypothetical protein A2Z15_04190 [Chloroflexi bacterium RBG_16_50_11]